MRSKLSEITARTPSSLVPFAAQSREEPLPYSAPAKITSGTFSSRIFHRGVIDRHGFAVRPDAWSSHLPARCRRRLGSMVKFLMRMLAKVPRIMTLVIATTRAVLVEVLQPRPDARRDRRRRATAALIDPAGEMWSVVILSPKRARMRASTMSVDRVRRPSSCPRNRAGSAHRSSPCPRHRSRPSARSTSRQCVVAMEHVGVARLEDLPGDVFLDVRVDSPRRLGQMSFRNTSWPSCVLADRVALVKSSVTVPAMACATTSGGEAR